MEAAALALLAQRYPTARLAILAGSVVLGQGTATSDLDLVLVDGLADAPFRASHRQDGWPVEVFAHTQASLETFFQSDVARRMPSLLQMCHEGLVLRDLDGLAPAIKQDVAVRLAAGPGAMTPAELDRARYFLTDLLDDWTSPRDAGEAHFISHALMRASVDLLLAVANRWTGNGKWTLRALRAADPERADAAVAALAVFGGHGDPEPIAAFAREALARAGGPLFDGYTAR